MSPATSPLPGIESGQVARLMTTKASLPAVGLAGLALVVWTLWWMKNGFDITDESYYVLWIQDPGNYSVSGSQFGSVYQPLYYILGQDVISLRRVNFLITVALGTTVSVLILKDLIRRKSRPDYSVLKPTGILTLGFAIASTSVTVNFLWLPTPNYNILTLQGLMVVVIGLALANRNTSRRSVVGWVLLAAGIWLTFLAKPTSAVAAGIVALLVLIAARKLSLMPVLISVATGFGLAIATAFVISGSIGGFISRVSDGATATNLMGGHEASGLLNSMVKKFWFGLESPLPVIVIFALVALGVYVTIKFKGLQIPALLISMVLCAWSIFVLLTHPASLTPQHVLAAATFGAILLGCACATMWLRLTTKSSEDSSVDGFNEEPRTQLVFAIAFALFPFCYSIGTNNVPLPAMLGATFFWVLSSAIFVNLSDKTNRRVLTISLITAMCQFTAAMALNQAFEKPYRSDVSIAESNIPVVLPASQNTVQMNSANARYFNELKYLADDSGFTVGGSLIELTGTTPGAALAIGAMPVGSPWLLGGYKGSAESVEFIFGQTNCSSVGAPWIITAPDSPRAIPSSTLKVLGIDFSNDYVRVGAIKSNKMTGEQYLWKPTASAERTLENCVRNRSTSPEN